MNHMIKIEKIHPHPDNPRKDVGDVTELADSIRHFGVLQNLILIPAEEGDEYLVLCGHRRLAATRKAMLSELPAEILWDIDRKEQIAMMLSENMQRSDLTVQEEAQGFQMMLDLGSSINDIIRKTGFSETKIRHRIKMNELDQDTLTEKMSQDISINDLIKLEQIKDIEERNKCLESIGTSDFDWNVKSAMRKQAKVEFFETCSELMKRARVEKSNCYTWQMDHGRAVTFQKYTKNDVAVLLNELQEYKESHEDDRPIIYTEDSTSITFGLERVKTEEDLEKAEKRLKEEAERKATQQGLENAWSIMNDLWVDFITGVSNTRINENIGDILGYFLKNGYFGRYKYIDTNKTLDLIDGGSEDEADDRVLTATIDNYLKTLLVCTFETMRPKTGPWDYWGVYRSDLADNEWAEFYLFMSSIGYEKSEMEQQILEGTSNLYRRKEQ